MNKSSLIAAAVILLGSTSVAIAHDATHFSAGQPGDPKKPARTVTVIMTDEDGAMRYSPDRLDVKRGEQVRFVIQNKGVLKHEFTLASVEDNNKHAVLMQKYPDMEHDDPNGKRLLLLTGVGEYETFQRTIEDAWRAWARPMPKEQTLPATTLK